MLLSSRLTAWYAVSPDLVSISHYDQDEAETLCNQIGIMAHGRTLLTYNPLILGTLRCIGTPLHLRNTHGEGYRLTIVFKIGSDDIAKSYVESQFHSAKNLSHYRSTMEFKLPSSVKIADVFNKMQKSRCCSLYL